MTTGQVNWKAEIVSAQTKEGLKLVLITGDVTCFATNVIVNTVPPNLQLGGGTLSKSLLQKGGPMLQKELNATKKETQERLGCILMTSGCNLDCKAVLHVVAPAWNYGTDSSLQIMANIIGACLKTIEQYSFSSVTFPMIGTGGLMFPKSTFANLILSEVLKFSSSLWQKTLQEVHFVVLPDDDQGHQAFLDEFTKRSSEIFDIKMNMLNSGDTQGIVSNPMSTRHEMKFGGITFQVAIGDITKETADVIVNSTTRTFNVKTGVSKAILEAAGPAVEYECAALATQTHRDYIITQGGYLQCKKIIHVLGRNDVRETVSSVLEECEQSKYTSVCLPVIGAGNAGKNPVLVADDIISSVVEHASEYPTSSLQYVKIIVIVPELLKIFCDNMEQRKNSMSIDFQHLVSKVASPWDFAKELPPPTNNPLYFEKETQLPSFQAWDENVQDDFSCMQNLTNNGQYSCSSEAECINDFDEKKVMIPLHWSNMNQQNFCMEVLPSHHQEYQDVANQFKQSCSNFTIIKIKRIQNLDLWDTYQIRKEIMDAKNGNIINEKQLFHGTDVDSVPYINRNGFNRSYAGKNGCSYGKGTYFAVNASYSAQFCKPDAKGKMYMYYVRVLTGLYTAGNSADLIAPPPKNYKNSTDLYDTVTDNMQNPKLFVVFYDYHAYPEYLITFKDNF